MEIKMSFTGKLFTLNIIACLVALWWIIDKYCSIKYNAHGLENIEYRYCHTAAEITSTLLIILTLILFVLASNKKDKRSISLAFASLNLLIFSEVLFALGACYLSDLSTDHAVIAFWRNNGIEFLQTGIFFIIVPLLISCFMAQDKAGKRRRH